MGRLRDYAIAFTGLKEGRHEFEFKIDDTFFAGFEGTEVHRGKLDASVLLERGTDFLDLKISIRGTVEVLCDRCLEPFNLPVDCTNKLYVRFGEKSYEQSDEVIILAVSESEINMAQYFYEFVHLALPYRKIHSLIPGGTCDKDMIDKLKTVMVDEQSDNKPDPRWEQLRKLI